jgi:hypothetical protein
MSGNDILGGVQPQTQLVVEIELVAVQEPG